MDSSAVKDKNAKWQYDIAVSVVQEGQDVDLYLSLMDGRFPISEDYDFASENMGPDDISVNSSYSWFRDRNWDTQYGVMFVVGVKARTANVSFNLVMLGPKKPTITQYTLETSLSQTNEIKVQKSD